MKLKKQLARGSKVVSLITFLGHILSTAVKLLISKNFGLLGFGQYALIMAFARFLSTVVQMGYNQSIVHFISKFRNDHDWNNVKHFFNLGLRHILRATAILVVSIFILKDFIIAHLDLENGGYYALFFIWSISTLIAINNYISGALAGLKLFKEQAILFTSSFPALLILGLFALKIFQADAPSINKFLGLGISLNALMLVLVFLFTHTKIGKSQEPGPEKESAKLLTKYSMPIWLSSSLQNATRNSDRIMLGIFSSLGQVAIYGAGLTFSILFAFPLKAMSPVFQPYIIEHYANKDYQGINLLYNTMVRWSSLFVIPAFSGLICFGDHFILAFGKGFEEAYGVMIILSFAQVISTIAGIAGTMLNITDKQSSHARIMVYGFLIAITLNLLLIPRFGAMGAAVGTGISFLIINIWRVRKIVKLYGLKSDYSIVLWLVLKFAPLVIFTFWIMRQAFFPWAALMVVYTLISGIIVYWSLSKNEKNYVRSLLGKIG